MTVAVNDLSRVMRKPTFSICENKDADQLAVTAKLISAFVFATKIVRSLYFLNPNVQASSYCGETQDNNTIYGYLIIIFFRCRDRNSLNNMP